MCHPAIYQLQAGQPLPRVPCDVIAHLPFEMPTLNLLTGVLTFKQAIDYSIFHFQIRFYASDLEMTEISLSYVLQNTL